MKTLSTGEILRRVPQQRPMRFIDEILEIDEEHIVAKYTWKEEDCAGHFPGNPVVPGVKLIEMCAQTGNVAWGIFLMGSTTTTEELDQLVGFFTQADAVVFKRVVRPGDTVAACTQFGETGYFRGGKLVGETEIQFLGGSKDGETIMTATTSGLWVPKDSETLK